MNGGTPGWRVVDVPGARRDVLDMIDLGSWQHRMFALIEVDVTEARRCIAAQAEKTGERVSFTGYLCWRLAQAVAADKTVQAYRKGRAQLVLFDGVDVGLMIERQVGEVRAPVGYVVRGAERKTVWEIHREIRAVQAGVQTAAGSDGEFPRWLAMLWRTPGLGPKLGGAIVRAAIRHDPARTWVKNAGTVGVTAVGMFGRSGGWGLSAPAGHTLCLIVGGIARKPMCVGERVEAREMLSLTVAFDHGVVDGAPAARFVQRLVAGIEAADGLF